MVCVELSLGLRPSGPTLWGLRFSCCGHCDWELILAARLGRRIRADGWTDGSLPFDAAEREGFEVAEVLFHDGDLETHDDVADDLACNGFMGWVGRREMRADEVGGGSGDGVACIDGVTWRSCRCVDRSKSGTCSLGLRSGRGVRVLGDGDGGACALCRALGSIIGFSDLSLALLLGIRGGVAIDVFGVQDGDGPRRNGCVVCAVGVLEVC